MEFTMPLPCTHRRPASITLHFELSIMTGTPRDVGLGGDEVQERRHRLLGVEHALVHVHVDDLGASSHLLARDGERLLVLPGEDQLRELRRAGDVGALADVDEVRVGADDEGLEAAEAGVRPRPPAGTRGAGCARSRRSRGCGPGVVPQQPPTMLTKPLSAKSRRRPAVIFGVSGKAPKPSGRPAFG